LYILSDSVIRIKMKKDEKIPIKKPHLMRYFWN